MLVGRKTAQRLLKIEAICGNCLTMPKCISKACATLLATFHFHFLFLFYFIYFHLLLIFSPYMRCKSPFRSVYMDIFFVYVSLWFISLVCSCILCIYGNKDVKTLFNVKPNKQGESKRNIHQLFLKKISSNLINS